jgi:hypothetical protein
MITCQHAHQLFDRYLDGELSASLQTELHAHRLNCSSCQNELAMLEACGDVITMDRCEPQVSVSFTDRVLMAQRGRRPVRSRRLGRRLLFLGSPMAAAASIAIAFFAMSPFTATKPHPATAIKGVNTAAPQRIQDGLTLTRDHSEAATRELNATPQMSEDTFLDTLLASVVAKSKTTVEGTMSGAKEFQDLIRRGLSDTNAMLVAGWQATQQKQGAAPFKTDRSGLDFDLTDPNNLVPPANGQDSTTHTDGEAHPEML